MIRLAAPTMPEMAILLITNVTSAAVCLWMACKLRRLPRPLRKRLMPKLLLSMAVSDSAFHVVSIGMVFVPGSNAAKCAFHRVWLIFLTLSVWLELAICCAFWLRASRRAHCLLPWLRVITVCFAMATVAVEFSVVTSSDDCDEAWETIVGSSGKCMIATASASLTCLLSAVWQSRTSSSIVEQRCFLRAIAFAANACITELPLVIYAFVFPPQTMRDKQPKQHIWRIVALILLSLKGLANGCTFFCQSRYSSGSILDVAQLRTQESYDVQWGNVEVQELGNA